MEEINAIDERYKNLREYAKAIDERKFLKCKKCGERNYIHA
jgi:hypothetical protein